MLIQSVPSRLLVMAIAMLFVFGLLPPLYPAQAADGIMNWSSYAFGEDIGDDGSMGNVINITLEQEDFAVQFFEADDYVTEGWATVNGVPDGMTCVIRPIDPTHCRIYLNGNASNHTAADSIDNLEIVFLDIAFTNNDASSVENSARLDIAVDFVGAAVEPAGDYDAIMNWSGAAFTEAAADDGTIANVIDISLDAENAEFEGFEQSGDMVADGLAAVNNLPAGLNCFIVSSDRGHCSITLVGEAEDHAVADSIGNLEIEFLDGAFTNGDAARIQNSARDDLEITFIEGEPVEGADIVATFTVGETSYFVNGVQNHMDVEPFAESNRTFVPVRYLAYCLGMTDDDVAWNGNNQTASLTEEGFTVILQIGNPSMNVDGIPQLMDVSPQARLNRIFLPARWVVEAFGGTVEWDQDTQTVTVRRDM